jgi:hypothetical protein
MARLHRLSGFARIFFETVGAVTVRERIGSMLHRYCSTLAGRRQTV